MAERPLLVRTGRGTIPLVAYAVGRHGGRGDSMYMMLAEHEDGDQTDPQRSHIGYEARIRPARGTIRFLRLTHDFFGQGANTVVRQPLP